MLRNSLDEKVFNPDSYRDKLNKKRTGRAKLHKPTQRPYPTPQRPPIQHPHARYNSVHSALFLYQQISQLMKLLL